MKIKNQVFLSFTTKEEYLHAVNVWKWNMHELVSSIRHNKWSIRGYQTMIAGQDRVDFFQIENLIIMSRLQNNKISQSKIAREMLQIRKKMKKLAGQQMEANRLQEKELIGV